MTDKPRWIDGHPAMQSTVNQYRERAEKAERRLAALKRAHVALSEQAARDQAAIDRVRALHQPAPDSIGGLSLNVGRRCAECHQHYRCDTIRSLDGPPKPTKPPTHLAEGTNAEDCPACHGTNPPYPFLCPGPTEEPTA